MLDALTPNPTIDEQVYTRLRAAIVDGQLSPGQDVVVTTVAAQLGVSRIPVMHACQRLVGEGFLVPNPRRSLTVAPLTEARITDGFEVLIALECLCMEHTARNATEALVAQWRQLNEAVLAFHREPGKLTVNTPDYRLHVALWEAAGRAYLFQQLRTVYDHMEPARVLSRIMHSPARSGGEHERLIDALARHDVPAAQDALRKHRLHGLERALIGFHARERTPVPGVAAIGKLTS